eukprot:TRINITY_DN462_c0_g2_i10.p1 TRINITY_DN462_c0_g2~~TRINITY_DN462_c0_g2_i10.p1  ORF type:complete len:449 (-),score=157.88 TRINITY_DN462_c0_g2_i10:82-1428(-)
MLAVADREWEVVKMLIDHGVDIFRPNSRGKTISDYLGDNDERVKEAKRLMNDKVERDLKKEQERRQEERQQKILQEEQAERDKLHLKILREQEAQEKARIQREEEEARQAERNRIQEIEIKLKERERIVREKEEANERARVVREEEEARFQIEKLRIQETELRLKQAIQGQKRQENSGKEEEIDSKKITVGEKVGSGNFGEVYKGTWDGHPVALKRLADETQEFFKEIGTVKSIHHPNIVRFYGVARIDGKLNLVTEFCDGGSLSDHLRKLDDYSLSQRDAVAMGLGIARGVAALHEKKIIHRDLATRNVLISTERNTPVMKVADFGLSRKLQSSEYYNKMEIVLPVRWSAPEVLSTGKYSTASDVWSFGITLWEIYEQGALPYGGVGGQEVGQNIMSGMKLLRPDQCIDDQIWNIIENCWKSRMQRPTMDAIVKDLNRIYEDMPMSG